MSRNSCYPCNPCNSGYSGYSRYSCEPCTSTRNNRVRFVPDERSCSNNNNCCAKKSKQCSASNRYYRCNSLIYNHTFHTDPNDELQFITPIRNRPSFSEASNFDNEELIETSQVSKVSHVQNIQQTPQSTKQETGIDQISVENKTDQDVLCKICVVNKITSALITCGHTFCFDCINVLKSKQSKECPFCRRVVDFDKNVLTLFIS